MLPAITFVLGKGGVGRSTVAAALGLGLARRRRAQGGRVLVMQWALGDPLSPWFGGPPAGYEARPLAPGLETMSFSAAAALEQYFVEHLHMRAFYRAIVSNRHVQRATRAAPGLEELMFLGTLMWLTSLAMDDRGWVYDHVVVDAPAMGHGASLLAMPQVTSTVGLGGLLAVECARVEAMLADSRRTGAVVVTTPEELAVEETLEFWPRIARDLGRPPLALVVNRSVARLGELPREPRDCAWLPPVEPALERAYRHLARCAARERLVTAALHARTLAVGDVLLEADAPAPREIVDRASAALEPLWGER